MRRIASAFISACSMALMAGAASADTFAFEFEFRSDQSAEANYAKLQRAAHQACRVNMRIAGGVSEKSRIETVCASDLLDQTIAQIGDRNLMALHETTKAAPQAQVYARLE